MEFSMDDVREQAALALADSLVENQLRQREESRGKASTPVKFPPFVVRAVTLVQACLRRRAFLRSFGSDEAGLGDEFAELAPPPPLLAVSLYFCRRARNPAWIDASHEALAVAGIIRAKEANITMDNVFEIIHFYEGTIPEDHMAFTILDEKLSEMIVVAAENLQEEVSDLSLPKDVHAVIERVREVNKVPARLEEQVLSAGRLRLQDVIAVEEARLRRELLTSYSVQEINAVGASLEEVFGPNVQTPVREEISTARLRRTQFLELELETRWSRPFAGPLPPHSRAARRYELELGKTNQKVQDFSEEERRYVSELESALEMQLATMRKDMSALGAKRGQARARSIIEDIDERISEIAESMEKVIEEGLEQIGPENARVTKLARDLLSVDSHTAVYSIRAESQAEELRIEVEAAEQTPEAIDRRRGYATSLLALLDELTASHPIQAKLREEFAEELEKAQDRRAIAQTEAEGHGDTFGTLPEGMSDFDGDFDEGGVQPLPKSTGSPPFTAREPEDEEDLWAAPRGYEAVVSTVPAPAGGPGGIRSRELPDFGDTGASEGPSQIFADPAQIELFRSFETADQTRGGLKEKTIMPLKAQLTCNGCTMDVVQLHTKPVLANKFVRAISEAVGISDQRIKVIDFKPGSLKVLLSILEPGEVDTDLDAGSRKSAMDARSVFTEIERQLEDQESKLRLSEIGPFLADASLKAGFEDEGDAFSAKMKHGSLSTAYLNDPFAVEATAKPGETGRSMAWMSTREPSDTTKPLTTLGESTWGNSRLAPGREQTFRTTRPNADEDETGKSWALPLRRQPMYSFYEQSAEDIAKEPLSNVVRLSPSKKKFSANASFHLTRHPAGGMPKLKGFQMSSTIDSWLEKGKEVTELEPAIQEDLDLKPKKASKATREMRAGKRKAKRGSASPEDTVAPHSGGEGEEAYSGKEDAGEDGRPRSAVEEPEPEVMSPAASHSEAEAAEGYEGEGEGKSSKMKPTKKAKKHKGKAVEKQSALEEIGEEQHEVADKTLMPPEKQKRHSRKEKKSLQSAPATEDTPAHSEEDPLATSGDAKGNAKEHTKARRHSKRASKLKSDSAPSGTDESEPDALLSTPAPKRRTRKSLLTRTDEGDEEEAAEEATKVDSRPPSRSSPSSSPKVARASTATGTPMGKSASARELRLRPHSEGSPMAMSQSSSPSKLGEPSTGQLSSYAGLYGGMPGTGLRSHMDSASDRLPSLKGRVDELNAPAYVRHAYRHGSVGIGPPYRTSEEGHEGSPAWSAMQMMDASIEKDDWRRTYSTAARGRPPKLGPQVSIRSNLAKGASVPRFPQLGPRRPQVAGSKKRRDSSEGRESEPPAELSRELDIQITAPTDGTAIADAVEVLQELPEQPPEPTETDGKDGKRRTRVTIRRNSAAAAHEEELRKHAEEEEKKKAKHKAKAKSKTKAKAKDKAHTKHKEKTEKKEEPVQPDAFKQKPTLMPSVGTWFKPLPFNPLVAAAKEAEIAEEKAVARTFAANALQEITEHCIRVLASRDLGAHRPPSASSSVLVPDEIVPSDLAQRAMVDFEPPSCAPFLEEAFHPPAMPVPSHAPRGQHTGSGPPEEEEEPEPMPDHEEDEFYGADVMRCSMPPSRAPSQAFSLEGLALASHAPSGIVDLSSAPDAPDQKVLLLSDELSAQGFSGVPSRALSRAPSVGLGSEPLLEPPSLPDPTQQAVEDKVVSRDLVLSAAGSYASTDTREKQRSCMMTNSGATKLEVEIFAQSLTSSIFRATGKVVKRPAAPRKDISPNRLAATSSQPAASAAAADGQISSPKRFKMAAIPANESHGFF